MHDTAIIFFFDEQGRRVPVFGEKHFPFIYESLHESYVKMAPDIKEKELYALFEGKEFLVWPVNSNQAAWTSLIAQWPEEASGSASDITNKIGEKIMEIEARATI